MAPTPMRWKRARPGLIGWRALWRSSSRDVAPDLRRNFHHAFKLTPLLLFGDDDVIKAPEPALRAYGELIEGNMLRGLVEASFKN